MQIRNWNLKKSRQLEKIKILNMKKKHVKGEKVQAIFAFNEFGKTFEYLVKKKNM